MGVVMYLINNVFSQAVFIIGIVVIAGMVAQKKTWDQKIRNQRKEFINRC